MKVHVKLGYKIKIRVKSMFLITKGGFRGHLRVKLMILYKNDVKMVKKPTSNFSKIGGILGGFRCQIRVFWYITGFSPKNTPKWGCFRGGGGGGFVQKCAHFYPPKNGHFDRFCPKHEKTLFLALFGPFSCFWGVPPIHTNFFVFYKKFL